MIVRIRKRPFEDFMTTAKSTWSQSRWDQHAGLLQRPCVDNRCYWSTSCACRLRTVRWRLLFLQPKLHHV